MIKNKQINKIRIVNNETQRSLNNEYFVQV